MNAKNKHRKILKCSTILYCRTVEQLHVNAKSVIIFISWSTVTCHIERWTWVCVLLACVSLYLVEVWLWATILFDGLAAVSYLLSLSLSLSPPPNPSVVVVLWTCTLIDEVCSGFLTRSLSFPELRRAASWTECTCTMERQMRKVRETGTRENRYSVASGPYIIHICSHQEITSKVWVT